jgi:hypothetical protein
MELFEKLKNIFDEDNTNYIYTGMIVYLLSDEESPYKMYKLNLGSNDRFIETVTSNISLVSEGTNYFHYPDCTSPDVYESISYLSVNEIPGYNRIKEKVINDEAEVITKRQILNVANKIKGYVIKVRYTEGTSTGTRTGKQALCFSKLSKSSFFKPEHPLFTFGEGNEDILQEVGGLFLKFSERIAAINIEETVFILHGYYFEQLLKYDEHINVSAAIAQQDIRNQGLISNIDSIDECCRSNKNVRKLLYKITKEGNINDVTIDKFRALKNKYGEALLYTINDNDTISVKEDVKGKSVMHILRIYNDEAAETIISGKAIFAHQKIDIA